jgi:hypothetical protein
MLKYTFVFVTLFHGLIHFMGFSKAFNYGTLPLLIRDISKPMGILWFVAGFLFILSTALYLFKKDGWVYIALMALVLSQLLIIYNWQEAKIGTAANVLILIVTVLGIFQIKFKKNYKDEVKLRMAKSKIMQTSKLSESEIAFLPHSVKKYIRYTGCIGKPKVNNFKASFSGKIRKDKKSEWMKLNSEQYNIVANPTRLFFLDAIMKHMPVAGFHCFKNSTAFMDIRLFSIFKVEYQSGYEMDISETVTFFNDMCVLAPATLIDNRIEWVELERNKVKATFTNNGINVSALLYFNEKGELVNFVSEDRYSIGENSTITKHTWSTPLREYKTIHDYKLASYAETIYTYPDGDFTYATFTLKNIEYNLTK